MRKIRVALAPVPTVAAERPLQPLNAAQAACAAAPLWGGTIETRSPDRAYRIVLASEVARMRQQMGAYCAQLSGDALKAIARDRLNLL